MTGVYYEIVGDTGPVFALGDQVQGVPDTTGIFLNLDGHHTLACVMVHPDCATISIPSMHRVLVAFKKHVQMSSSSSRIDSRLRVSRQEMLPIIYT